MHELYLSWNIILYVVYLTFLFSAMTLLAVSVNKWYGFCKTNYRKVLVFFVSFIMFIFMALIPWDYDNRPHQNYRATFDSEADFEIEYVVKKEIQKSSKQRLEEAHAKAVERANNRTKEAMRN